MPAEAVPIEFCVLFPAADSYETKNEFKARQESIFIDEEPLSRAQDKTRAGGGRRE
jgi:hypothetical protein